MASIKFGTDGWRGVIADDFTFDNVALCAQGVARYLQEQGAVDGSLVVGYDTRFASREFAERVAEVMAGNGIPTLLTSSPAPTPVVSYNVLHRKAPGAAIITASHNPAGWNGFKFKPDYAGSATPEITDRLEAEIGEAEAAGVRSLPLETARGRGLVRDLDPAPPYLEQVARLVDLEAISQSGIHVVVDAMYGAGAGYGAALLPRLATLTEIHGHVNPAFPGLERPEPVDSNLADLSQAVLERGADVGIAFDGDADRVGIVDEKGRFITPLQTYGLLALYLLEARGERGALVKSLTTTSMVYSLGERYGVPVFETAVGFKHICPIMIRENALMGGEESGGFGFRGHIPERDGLLSGLLVLEQMARSGKRPSELLEELYGLVGPHHYRRRDRSFPAEDRDRLSARLEQAEPDRIAGTRVVRADSLDGRRYTLAGNEWVLMRFSGTEPLLRTYAEAGSPEKVEALLDAAEELLGL
ncbi:MAG: phosphoglucomutase/phosphomannomutase family protein [Dehalococcoidia bacterium]|nr:phosphoglucomutase/phosphomannomutase family protein [Dehalococcoidia bacterium]